MTKKAKQKRRPASYFIDYENVRGAGLDGVETLAKGDRVTVLYGSKDSALKLEQVQNVLNSPAKVEFIKVATGKHDALDFQLVALMFMNMKKKRDYFIISKDTGFDFAIRMAKVRGMEHVYRRETISGATLEPKKLPSPRRSRSAKRLPQPKDAANQQQRDARPPAKGQATQPRPPEAVAAQQGPDKTPDQPIAQGAAPTQQVQAGAQPEAQPASQPAPQPAPAASPAAQPEVTPAPQPSKSSRRRRRKAAVKAAQPAKDAYRQGIEDVLAKHMGSLPAANQVDVVIAGLEKCETKARFYNYLRGNLGNEQGLALYRDVKGCFDQLRAVEKPAE